MSNPATMSIHEYRSLVDRQAAHAATWRKYRNVPQVVDGQRFDSKREANRHAELVLLLQGGRIEKLERQVTFPLVVEGVKVGSIRPDWTYIDVDNDLVIAEDSKGHQTDVHKLRWKLAKVLYPLIEWRLS